MKSPHWKTLAELVGISALVASLFFVGYQLKQDRQFAEAQTYANYLERHAELYGEINQYAEVLARANSGADLSDAEAIIIRYLVMHANDDAFLLQAQSAARTGRRPNYVNTSELVLAAFLYKNPGARQAWLEINADRQALVDVLRSPEDRARSGESGSIAFRNRVNAHLERLDELQP
jgi:hypothetical protein